MNKLIILIISFRRRITTYLYHILKPVLPFHLRDSEQVHYIMKYLTLFLYPICFLFFRLVVLHFKIALYPSFFVLSILGCWLLIDTQCAYRLHRLTASLLNLSFVQRLLYVWLQILEFAFKHGVHIGAALTLISCVVLVFTIINITTANLLISCVCSILNFILLFFIKLQVKTLGPENLSMLKDETWEGILNHISNCLTEELIASPEPYTYASSLLIINNQLNKSTKQTRFESLYIQKRVMSGAPEEEIAAYLKTNKIKIKATSSTVKMIAAVLLPVAVIGGTYYAYMENYKMTLERDKMTLERDKLQMECYKSDNQVKIEKYKADLEFQKFVIQQKMQKEDLLDLQSNSHGPKDKSL